jgi:hypothetical protein
MQFGRKKPNFIGFLSQLRQKPKAVFSVCSAGSAQHAPAKGSDASALRAVASCTENRCMDTCISISL